MKKLNPIRYLKAIIKNMNRKRLSALGKIFFLIGAIRFKNGEKKIRVLNPIALILMPIVFILSVLVEGFGNFQEVCEDWKEQLCWW